MAPSVRVRFGKKAKTGLCDNCQGWIDEGCLHAAVMQSFGLSKHGKGKYKGSHVHASCLSAFLIQDYTRYMCRERKPKGRKEGSSLDLTVEQWIERKHLIRTRARLLRLVLETTHFPRVEHLKGRILEIQIKLRDCGGPARQSMVRRSLETRTILKDRLHVV